MDAVLDYAFLAILFPIIGLLLNAFLGDRWRERGVAWVACLASGAALVVSLLVFAALLGRPPEARLVERTLYPWISAGALQVPFALRLDPLSVTMMLVVTGVGTIIHIYAVGYMHGDPRFQRFFVYMNLFLASMLVLVMGNNYLVLFIGWELVGLCSYLLIGFWFEDLSKAAAARKAFVVNRIGDFGFLLGLFLLFVTFGTLEFGPIFEMAEQSATVALAGLTLPMRDVVTIITLLLFVGAVGKSAQIPLYVWLPDAMAGPTPVSALIHAATMVTAGVYMVTRSAVLYEMAPLSSGLVAWVGALTALLAATIAVGQFDIKRVLAYSTISQLGFMMAAVGLGGYTAGMFHLITHAFFKALLFLAAGSVIHGLQHGMHASAASQGAEASPASASPLPPPDPHDPQDMRNMGGLRERQPLTFWTYTIGALALAGLPPLAGFFSKDEILADALERNPAIWLVLTVAAFFTAFYMGRQLWLIFFGRPRTEAAAHAEESGPVMTIPLILLALGSVVAGLINFPGPHPFADFIRHHAAPFNPTVALTSTVLALIALGLAYRIYRDRLRATTDPDPLLQTARGLFVGAYNAWYVDRSYHRVFVQGFYALAAFLARPVEAGVIDGTVNGVARLVRRTAGQLRRLQTGYVRQYALAVMVGVVAIVAWFLLSA